MKAAHLRTIKAEDEPESDAPTILQVCQEHLNKVQDEDSAATYKSRAATLLDFCMGLPPRFRTNGKKPKKSDYIHKGYGRLPADRLTKLHVNHGCKLTHRGTVAGGPRFKP